MAFISLIRDLDAAIRTAPFNDGQIAVAQDKDRIYIDTTVGNTTKRITIDNDTLRDQKSSNLIYLWIGTQDEYDDIQSPDSHTLYITTDSGITPSAQGFQIVTTTTSSDIVYSIRGEQTKPFLKFVLSS